jgi:hypothetical protein
MINVLVDGNILVINTAAARKDQGLPNKSWVTMSFTDTEVRLFDNAVARDITKLNPYPIPFDEFTIDGVPQNTADLIFAALKDIIGQ